MIQLIVNGAIYKVLTGICNKTYQTTIEETCGGTYKFAYLGNPRIVYRCSKCTQESMVVGVVEGSICDNKIKRTVFKCDEHPGEFNTSPHNYNYEIYVCEEHQYEGEEQEHTFETFKDYYCSTHSVSSTTSSTHTYNDPCVHTQTSLHFPN